MNHPTRTRFIRLGPDDGNMFAGSSAVEEFEACLNPIPICDVPVTSVGRSTTTRISKTYPTKFEQTMNILCGICKDPLNVLHSKGEHGTNASALPCGHVFHSTCVNQWFDTSTSARSGTCPHCRAALLKSKALKLYWDVEPVEVDDDPACVKAVNECLQRDNQDLKERLQTARDKTEQLSVVNQTLRENVLSLESKLSAAALSERMLTVTRQKLNSKTKENENLKDEIEKLRRKNESMRACNTVMNGSLENGEEKEVFQLMEKEQIAMLCMNFKKDGKNLEKRYESTRQDLMKAQSENRELRKKLDECVAEMSILTNVLDAYKRKAIKIPRLSGEASSSKPTGEESSHTKTPSASALSLPLSPIDLTGSSPCTVPKVSTPSAPPLRSQNASLGAVPRTNGPTCSKRSLVDSPSKAFSGTIRKTCGSDRQTVADPRRVTALQARASLSSGASTAKLSVPEFYDGLGGHSRLDDFPKPKIKTDRKILKAKRTPWK